MCATFGYYPGETINISALLNVFRGYGCLLIIGTPMHLFYEKTR